jgi:ABC-type branched-subunit amino acid transport system substrate-binding protein
VQTHSDIFLTCDDEKIILALPSSNPVSYQPALKRLLMLTLIEHSNGEEIMKRSYWIVYGLLTGMLIIFWTTSAWAADVIKIGIIGPMEYSYGKNQWNGALMAAEEINNGGGIKVGKERMKVQLIKADSKEYTGVTKAVDAMEQLTAKLAKFKSNQEFIELISGAHVAD